MGGGGGGGGGGGCKVVTKYIHYWKALLNQAYRG